MKKISVISRTLWVFMGLAMALAVLNLIQPAARAADGIWTNTTSGGLWSATGNWSGGTAADGSGSSAYFSTMNITADNTVHMDAAHTLSALVFGDLVTGSAAGSADSDASVGSSVSAASGFRFRSFGSVNFFSRAFSFGGAGGFSARSAR